MTTRRYLPALMLVFGLAACGGAESPEAQLSAIKEKLAKNLPMSSGQKSEVEQLLNEGSRLLAANQPEQASAAFEKALTILKAAEDADRFNKAE